MFPHIALRFGIICGPSKDIFYNVHSIGMHFQVCNNWKEIDPFPSSYRLITWRKKSQWKEKNKENRKWKEKDKESNIMKSKS